MQLSQMSMGGGKEGGAEGREEYDENEDKQVSSWKLGSGKQYSVLKLLVCITVIQNTI